MAQQRITWSLGALILLLPTYLLHFKIGPLRTNLLDILLLMLIAYGLYLFRTERLRFKGPIFFWPALLLLIAAAISIFFAKDTAAALGAFKSWFFLPIVLVTILSQFKWEPLQKRRLLYFLVAGGTVAAAWAIIRFFSPHTWIDYQGVKRAVGFFTQPNYLALAIIAPAIISTGLAIKAKPRNERIIFIVSSLILVSALALSYSRAGMVAYATTFLIGALALYGWRTALLSAAAFALLFGVAYSVVPSVKTRFATIFDTKSQTTSRTRVEIDHATFAMLKDHPIQGIGLANYQNAYSIYRLPDALEKDVLHPHNIFFAFWTQTGLLGLLAFLVLCIQLLVVKPWRNGSESTLAFLAVIATLVFGLFDTPYWKNDLSLLFWLPLLIIHL